MKEASDFMGLGPLRKKMRFDSGSGKAKYSNLPDHLTQSQGRGGVKEKNNEDEKR